MRPSRPTRGHARARALSLQARDALEADARGPLSCLTWHRITVPREAPAALLRERKGGGRRGGGQHRECLELLVDGVALEEELPEKGTELLILKLAVGSIFDGIHDGFGKVQLPPRRKHKRGEGQPQHGTGTTLQLQREQVGYEIAEPCPGPLLFRVTDGGMQQFLAHLRTDQACATARDATGRARGRWRAQQLVLQQQQLAIPHLPGSARS